MKIISLSPQDDIDQIVMNNNNYMKVSTPFVSKLHYTFNTNQRLFLVSGYLEMGELLSHIDQVKGDVIKFYAAEIVLALESLHRSDIIFRDLYPKNILISNGGHVVLTSSGYPKDLINEDISSDYLEYLAPEVIMGKPYSASSDWWAFGILLYRIFVGKTPFYSEDMRIMQEHILNGSLLIPKQIPYSAGKLIKVLLDKNPENRIQADNIKAHQFFVNIDWKSISSMDHTPPIVPSVEKDNTERAPKIEGQQEFSSFGFDAFTYVSK